MKLVTKINNTVPELSVKGFIDPRDGLLTIKVKKNSHAFSDGKVNIVVNCDYEPEEPKDNVRRELRTIFCLLIASFCTIFSTILFGLSRTKN